MTVRRGNGFGYQNTSIIAIGILRDYAPPLFCGRGGIVQERNQWVRLMVPVVPHVLLELWPAHLEIEEVVPRPVAEAVRPLTSLPALLLSLWTQSETAAGTGFLHPAAENRNLALLVLTICPSQMFTTRSDFSILMTELLPCAQGLTCLSRVFSKAGLQWMAQMCPHSVGARY